MTLILRWEDIDVDVHTLMGDCGDGECIYLDEIMKGRMKGECAYFTRRIYE
jgi:hypothetical protein